MTRRRGVRGAIDRPLSLNGRWLSAGPDIVDEAGRRCGSGEPIFEASRALSAALRL